MDISANAYWSSKSQIDDLPDLETGLEAMTINNVNRNDSATTFNGITTGSSPPSGTKSVTAGEGWHNTSAISGGPSQHFSIYNSSVGDWIGMPMEVASSAPSWTNTTLQWYDTSAKVKRMYRAAVDDVAGIAGWHSIQPGYELWTNLTGATVAPGYVVCADATVGHRQFILPQATKDANVVGVAAETITASSSGLVALASHGPTVLVNCTTATHTIAKGDGLVCNAAGDSNARSVGSIDSKNPNATTGVQSFGTPYGCFAQAMEAVAVATVGVQIKARLLGYVGEGRTIFFAEDELATDSTTMASANWDGSWRDINLRAAENGGDIIADNGSTKHLPILGAYMTGLAQMSHSNNADIAYDLRLGPNASAAHAHMYRDVNGSLFDRFVMSEDLGQSYVATAGGSGAYTSLGEVVTWRGDKSASVGTITVVRAELHVVGYRY